MSVAQVYSGAYNNETVGEAGRKLIRIVSNSQFYEFSTPVVAVVSTFPGGQFQQPFSVEWHSLVGYGQLT